MIAARIALCAFALVLLPSCSNVHRSQEYPRSHPREPYEGETRLSGGVGLTDSPDAFLLAGQADIYLTSDVAVGPKLQFGIDGNDTIVAPTINVKKLFHIYQGQRLSRWKPFVQGGLGFAFLAKDDRGARDDDDLGLMLSVGAGVEVFLDDNLSVGTGLDVNFMPGEVLDEDVFVSFRLFEIGMRF